MVDAVATVAPCTRVIDGELVVKGYIGRGNHAYVYDARYQGRLVAVKIVPHDVSSAHSLFSIQSLIHEARVLRKYEHRCASALLAATRAQCMTSAPQLTSAARLTGS